MAVDSLFVVGGNAVATEHVLVPRVSRDAKGKDSRDWKNSPDDAPVELDGTPRVSWNLLRCVGSSVEAECNVLLYSAGERVHERMHLPSCHSYLHASGPLTQG